MLSEQKATDNAGHRKRVYNRFMKDCGESMEDYELLEFVLMQAIPRRDVKPIAKELLRRFGSFAKVVYAPVKELREVGYIKDSACAQLKIVASAVRRVCYNKLQEDDRPILDNVEGIVDYAKATMGYDDIESVSLIYLDANGKFLGAEKIQQGTLNEVNVYPREIINQVLAKKASGIIMIHNHPSNNVKPSIMDDNMTLKIVDACKLIGVLLYDHIIIGASGYFSYRSSSKCVLLS